MKRLPAIPLFLLFFGVPDLAHAAVEVMLLGPKTYSRAPGRPNLFTEEFPAVQGVASIMVENLGGAGELVSSAVIRVNGDTIYEPNNFNHQITEIQRPILVNARNWLSVELRGRPGATLRVRVIQVVQADAAAIIGPGGGSVQVTDLSSPIRGLTVEFPPGALPSSVVVRAEYDPDNRLTFRPDIEEGIALPAFRLEPSDLLLTQPATIRIPYLDENDDDLIDGTDLPAHAARVFFLREGDLEIFRGEAFVDVKAKQIVVPTRHVSIWLTGFGRWLKGLTVRYYIESLPSDVFPTSGFYSREQFRIEIANALGQWTAAVDGHVTFAETSSILLADVTIRIATVVSQRPSSD